MFSKLISIIKFKIYLIYGGDFTMYEFLAYRVITGHLTCVPEKATKTKRLIPERLRPRVIEILKEMDFDADGQPLTTEEKE